MLTIEPKMIILFEHAIQSILKMCIFEIRSWSHTKPRTIEYIGNIKIKVVISGKYTNKSYCGQYDLP